MGLVAFIVLTAYHGFVGGEVGQRGRFVGFDAAVARGVNGLHRGGGGHGSGGGWSYGPGCGEGGCRCGPSHCLMCLFFAKNEGLK